jgi:hypothetical protein
MIIGLLSLLNICGTDPLKNNLLKLIFLSILTEIMVTQIFYTNDITNQLNRLKERDDSECPKRK